MQSLAKPASGYHQVIDGNDLPSLFGDIFEDIACTPGIKVVKSADPTTLPAGGGEVTYTFKVTNVGNVALTNVDVTDEPVVRLDQPRLRATRTATTSSTSTRPGPSAARPT